MLDESKISAVFPLNIDEKGKSNSCEVADMLFASLRKFAEPDLFGTIYLVCPSRQKDTISSHMKKWTDLPLEFVDENVLLPELLGYQSVGGWRKQQILKLAAARIVTAPYYITFDADVVCTHPICKDNLLPGGKALIQLISRKVRPLWWLAAGYQLGVPVDLDKAGMAPTPAILSTQVVRGLIQELSAEGGWVKKLLGPHKRFAIPRFLPHFREKYQWTEYSLYYLYMEKHGLLESHHVVGGRDDMAQTLISENSVWKRVDFDAWNDDVCFSGEDPALFVIIQSNKNIPAECVWNRIRRHLEAASPE